MIVAMSVDKSKICYVWLDFGSVPTPESIFASDFTPGTDSMCSDATNTVSPDSANQNRAFGTCGGSGTRTGTVPPLMLGQKWSSPSPEHLNRSTGRSNMHLKHLETSEGLQPMQPPASLPPKQARCAARLGCVATWFAKFGLGCVNGNNWLESLTPSVCARCHTL